MIHSFEQKKAESKSPQQQRVDKATIRLFFPDVVEVTKTNVNVDRTGVDYKATLRRGAVLLIDAKSRKPGCSRFWEYGPELAIEKWSVKPGGKYETPEDDKKAGWALCESTNVDLILYTFDPSDTKESFLLPFQHLRMALRMFWDEWHALYPLTTQESENEDGKRWESEALLVPAYVVLEAIRRVSRLSVP